MGSDSPNFMKAYILANQILVTSEIIKKFPFPMKDFLREQTDIVCRQFESARKYGLNIANFGSESAMLISQNGHYIIFYNQNEPTYRIRFSIAHEAGHYFLEHQFNVEGEVYNRQEIEANYFAAQLLMPEQLLLEAGKRGETLTAKFIMTSFGVSAEAAHKRLNTMHRIKPKWKNAEEKRYDDIIIAKYSLFLEEISPKPKSYFDLEYEFRYLWMLKTSRR